MRKTLLRLWMIPLLLATIHLHAAPTNADLKGNFAYSLQGELGDLDDPTLKGFVTEVGTLEANGEGKLKMFGVTVVTRPQMFGIPEENHPRIGQASGEIEYKCTYDVNNRGIIHANCTRSDSLPINFVMVLSDHNTKITLQSLPIESKQPIFLSLIGSARKQ